MSEKISLFEKLSEKFETKNIPPYGAAVIIPCKDFKGEWKERLLKEDMRIFSNSYLGETCFFIRKSKPISQDSAEPLLHEEAMSTVEEDDNEESKATQKKRWTEQDKALLLDLYGKGIDGNKIAKRLKRSVQEIGNYIRHNVSSEMKILRKEKVEALYAESRSKGSKRKHAKSWRRDETLKLIELLAEGKSAKEASKILNRSVKSIAAKMKYLPSSPESKDLEKPKRKRGIPFTSEEQEEFEILCREGLTSKEISEKMGKSIFQVGAKLMHFKKAKDPEIDPSDEALMEVVESSLLLLKHNKKRAAQILLQESIKRLGKN